MDKRIGKGVVRKRITIDDGRLETAADFSLDDLFNVFIEAKRAQGLAERTILDHHKNYRYLCEWLYAQYPDISPQDIDTQVIREWIIYMRDHKVAYDTHPTSPQEYVGLAPGTINVRLRSMKTFFRFLFDEGYLPTDPTSRVPLMKVEDDGVHAFTPEQVKLLLAQPDRTTYVGFRDYALMLLLIDTGMRINEALHLTVEDVDLRTLGVTIPARIAKTRKSRQVPISKQTAKQLGLLINEVKLQFDEFSRIFVSNYGEQFHDNYFRARLKKYAIAANIQGVRVSPHTFRHTFAKMFILNGGDPFTLQRILGHADLTMSKRYVNLFAADIQAVHRRATPLETLKL